ncbi:hypothetical protein ASPWEDRAFT_175069 [Aspergillus wentii DTO 134E9]|uniref:Uncharacterized protein n=1 Tax=Aspergillus wentii DTO 134E9 TaxID=1073089 RepID=A0A1L9R9Z2_ASPWE|nr:uncharacterized protein ASPWEDRAFT_175069 [Aspergillus wentii DTO 134E9]KAI9927373.1 hypothetical protein MW887_002985 [Aspergillus wentii]OJJ31745.1 hypothetical protein ASPWEDRAFT_175069 [Aspergillus wentii DTO 134E9]
MDLTGSLLAHASTLQTRAESSSSGRPAVYKAIGISLAVASGLFIGVSFVLKKTGLLKANVKYNEEAGEGYGYLKNVWWWTGMTLMIVGEICNFVAYAFVDAILVTPLGALSVVITTILSAIFLKERLSFVGKVGCFCCILGSVIIAMNAPEQSSVSDIQTMQHYVIAPGFLSYAGVIIVGSIFTAVWAGPRYGKKSMFVYISICSMVGGLSVVATQGLGSAILAQINGEPQFNKWFLYVLFVFVIATLLTEIIYLNKALNLFNAALVTPTYYVFFTSATIVTSAVLFQGFKGSAVQITTVVLGFLQICAGVVLLQLSKSAKDVPDAAVFKGDLDQVREVATQEEPESEPKADSIRGAAAIIRRISTARRNTEAEEARRYFREKHEDTLKPPSENEIIEWDGLRRRRTILGEGHTMSRPHTPGTPQLSRKGSLPPWGMSRFPEEQENDAMDQRPSTKQSGHSFLDGIRSRTSSVLHQTPQWRPIHEAENQSDEKDIDIGYHGPGKILANRHRSDTSRSITWADEAHPGQSTSRNSHLAPDPPPHGARRQFSFNTVFNRMKSGSESSVRNVATPPRSILRHTEQKQAPGTEEERLGLVKGDSRNTEDEFMNEKLDRSLSSSSESSAGDYRELVQPQQPHGRPRQSSISTMSTAAFPPYEDHHAYYTQADYYSNYPASQSRGNVNDGWQVPIPGGRAQSSSVPSQRRPNPLPPLPDEAPLVTSGEPYMRVELRSPGHSPNNSQGSVSSLQTTQRSRRASGWRRPDSLGGDDGRGGSNGQFIP